MSNSLIALALVALALGVTLMETLVEDSHTGTPSPHDRGQDMHDGPGS